MTERQKFDLVNKHGKVEIRRYHPCVMADVVVSADYQSASSLGFRPLVTYISKNNIAMTAPVIQEEKAANNWTVSFVMPAEMKLADLPIPSNAQVSLRTCGEELAVVLPFGGFATEEKAKEAEGQLRAILNKEKLIPTGPVRIARFDPPWKPSFLRYNEVILPIQSA